MSTPLLMTKFFAPPYRPGLLARPNLVAQLESGVNGALVLISASAGFGKTTLVSEWLASNQRLVAWLTLDEEDNDPKRFLSYFVSAMQCVTPGLGEAILGKLVSQGPLTIDSLLVELANEISQLKHELVFVLDNYHLVTDKQVHAAMTFLLTHPPAPLHLIVCSRSDPPWALARMRTRSDITVLRTSDLCFTRDESIAFFNDIMGLGLSEEQINLLDSRIEGWIAGLQMAGLSMQGRQDIAAFIRSFTGSHRYIFDYLMEEVLELQTEEVYRFLLKTSILEQFCAALCDEVLGIDNSRAILQVLDQGNLFLVPLDQERVWYRYHHLFADLLRKRLGEIYSDEARDLHARAGEWYEKRGLLHEAARQHRAAGDHEGLTVLIERNALAMAYHGHLTTLTNIIQIIPDEFLGSRPWLCIARAWILAFGGQFDAVPPLLEQLDKMLSGIDDESKIKHLQGHRALILAHDFAMHESIAEGKKYSQKALSLLPEEDLIARSLATLILGVTLRMNEETEASNLALEQAYSLSIKAGDFPLCVDVLWEQCMLQSALGNLHRVMEICQIALALADEYNRQSGERLSATGYTYTLMSDVCLEWNDVERALNYARKAFDLCGRWGQADARVWSCFSLARAQFASGDFEGALQVLQQAKQVASSLGPWHIMNAGSLEAWMRAKKGDIHSALHWLQESGLALDGPIKRLYFAVYLRTATILLQSGDTTRAQSVLARLEEAVTERQFRGTLANCLVLQAVMHYQLGKNDKALEVLSHALVEGESEGYVRMYINEGEPMVVLLKKALSKDLLPVYVNKILAGLQGETALQETAQVVKGQSLLEPLTERELDVLRLLMTELAIPEIAQELYIAVSTVRTHVKTIYQKLDAHSRLEAIARARELALF